MESNKSHQSALAPEVRRFIERAGAGEKVTAEGEWFAGEDEAVETARPYNISDLVNLRKLVRKTAEAYAPGDINSSALGKLLDSVDDTIEQLIGASGDEKTILEHRQLRERYQQGLKNLDHPAVRAAQEGRLDLTELLKDSTVVNGQTGLDALVKALEPEAVKQLANTLLDSKIRKACTTLKDGKEVIGVIRPEEVLSWYKEIKDIPGTDKFFQVDTETSARYAKTMADLENVASVKKMTKRGIAAAFLIALALAIFAVVFLILRYG